MSKLVMHWQVLRDGEGGEGGEGGGGAEFFLYRSGEDVHCDHRRYSRDELERRAGAMQASVGDVPLYYQHAIAALADPRAESSGNVPLDALVNTHPADLDASH